jgi:DNA-directed RNA polymerase subunit beta
MRAPLLFRKNFGIEIHCKDQLPSLTDFQVESYQRFLQRTFIEKREMKGLELVFQSVFPIDHIKTGLKIEYIRYEVGYPAYEIDECKLKGYTYGAPVCIFFRISNEKTGMVPVEKKTYLGEMPIMCPDSKFIINGVSRIVISQLKKTSGVLIYGEKSKSAKDNGLYAKLIPSYGSWLTFFFDFKGLVYFRIDKKKKLLASTFLMSLAKTQDTISEKGNYVMGEGMTKEDLLKTFYSFEVCRKDQRDSYWQCPLIPQYFAGIIFKHNIYEQSSEKILIIAGEALSFEECRKKKNKTIFVHENDFPPFFTAKDIVNINGLVLIDAGEQVTGRIWKQTVSKQINEFEILLIKEDDSLSWRNTVVADKNFDRKESLLSIAKVLKLTDQTNISVINEYFKNLFFDVKNFDFSDFGRENINNKLEVNIDKNIHHLTQEDIIGTIKKLIDVKMEKSPIDDIDCLSNKRVCVIGELMFEQCLIGAKKMAKAAKERIASYDLSLDLSNLISGRLFFFKLKKMFNVSNVSQFSDEYNELSVVAHSRRVSAATLKLSTGVAQKGTKHRADGARNVHDSEYGKLCAITTPEGQSIGLIKYLAIFTKVSEHGVLSSPYYSVKNGIVDITRLVFLNVNDEKKYIIASSSDIDTSKKPWTIKESNFIKCRYHGVFATAITKDINYVSITPIQNLSVSAGLIPCIESNDAFRALVGSNMQRQAVVLVAREAPLVGTGIESVVAINSSKALVRARKAGIVKRVDSERIVIVSPLQDINIEKGTLKDIVNVYFLKKFERTNQNTILNQSPIVKVGTYVEEDDIIADSSSTDRGDLAIGVNALVAFVSSADVYEDSICVSKKFAHQMDKFTSIQAVEFECVARDTKNGEEMFSRDIPGVAKEHLTNLDEDGIILEGSIVHPGMILVGKVAYENLHSVSDEQRLLSFIFKKSESRDCSLRVSQGVNGVVVSVKVVRRSGTAAGEGFMLNELKEIEKNKQILKEKISLLDKELSEYANDNGAKTSNKKQDTKMSAKIEQLKNQQIREWEEELNKKLNSLKTGSDLLPAVIAIAYVVIMEMRKLGPGDKLCGRHGNKGVTKSIIPVEDMPFLQDGTPVDIIFNALSLTARMNIGQLWETHLGMACYMIGKKMKEKLQELTEKIITFDEFADMVKIITSVDIRRLKDDDLYNFVINLTRGLNIAVPPYQRPSIREIEDLFEMGGMDKSGDITLYDGKTGEKLGDKYCVGIHYVLKLYHMAVDKKHARSVGPYSMSVLQPLAGRANRGGQRFGSMEVWALQAYGAAYTLREMLTIKSDDVIGRGLLHESLLKGELIPRYGMPSSFEVLKAHLQALGIFIEVPESNKRHMKSKKANYYNNQR